MAAAVGVLDDVRHHAKPVPIEQRTIFGRIEAARDTAARPAKLPIASPCAGPLVNISAASGAACARNIGNIVALVVGAEVKEAVPRQDAGKLPLQGKLAHIGDDPFLRRENAAGRHPIMAWRRVDANRLG